MPWIRIYIPFFAAALAAQLATAPCLAQQPIRFAGNDTTAPSVRIASRGGVGYATERLEWSNADAGDTLLVGRALDVLRAVLAVLAGVDLTVAAQAPIAGDGPDHDPVHARLVDALRIGIVGGVADLHVCGEHHAGRRREHSVAA